MVRALADTAAASVSYKHLGECALHQRSTCTACECSMNLGQA